MFFNAEYEQEIMISVKNIQPLAIKARPSKKNAEIFTKLVSPVNNLATGPEFNKRELCLYNMFQNRQNYLLITIDDIKDEQGNPLYVFLKESDLHFTETLVLLRKKYRDYVGTQIGFNESKPDFNPLSGGKPDLWWNLNLGILWSFDKKFMKNMKEYLDAYQVFETDCRLRSISWFSETDFVKS
jgi:hypothetical protein